jgi:hypothetical protein
LPPAHIREQATGIMVDIARRRCEALPADCRTERKQWGARSVSAQATLMTSAAVPQLQS